MCSKETARGSPVPLDWAACMVSFVRTHVLFFIIRVQALFLPLHLQSGVVSAKGAFSWLQWTRPQRLRYWWRDLQTVSALQPLFTVTRSIGLSPEGCYRQSLDVLAMTERSSPRCLVCVGRKQSYVRFSLTARLYPVMLILLLLLC